MRLIYLTIGLFLFMCLSANANESKKIYGLYEKVQLPEISNNMIKAKLDTGALTSSLGATDITLFEKDGEDWVSFKPQVKNLDLPVIEKPLERESKIKRRMADRIDDESHTNRPVVMLDICFDGQIYAIEVNLTDRSHFNYPLLLASKSLIQFNAIVDPSLQFESSAKCNP